MLKRALFADFKQTLLLPLAVALLAVVGYFLDNFVNGALSDLLVYHSSAIGQGELWRLISGHFFHTNGYHLLLNLGAMTLLFGLHGRYYRFGAYLMLFLLSALGTSIGIYYFAPELKQYVGLSGVLHGVFIWGALMDIKHQDKTGYLLLLGICLKVAHEQLYGASEEVINLIDANVAIDAHLWGAISGLIFGLYSWFSQNNKAKIQGQIKGNN
ncbi:rhombosortase [Thalassomonas haliotis]|uniref:Rhombosortase n=2 Tax=Thalassomonas haliotis TaxID=485448 RepID=A0ABY7VM73_9GAMM|nr:rhombosortase [Thalassomonas haliotis]WDE13752.1 rhombosortase [Thalassomonas haliotis]